MPRYGYRVKAKFGKLVKKWNKLTKIGFFYTHSPVAKMSKDTIVTLIFFSQENLNKAKKILGKNPCK